MDGKLIPNAPSARLPELDGLRAIAVLLVLCAHLLCFMPIPWFALVVEKGWVGVDLFFVLSGFLIGGILLDNRPAENYYRVFYLRRFLRIVPLYAVLVFPGLLILSCGLQSHFSGHSLAGQSAVGAWLCVFFVQNFGSLFHLDVPQYLAPTWSVAVEEQFYLLLPPLVRNLDRKQILKILMVAIVFAPLLRGIMIMALGSNATRPCYTLLPCRWDSLLLGVACALACRHPNFRPWLASRWREAQIFWLLSILGSIAWLFCTQGRSDPRFQFLGYTWIDLCFACTLLLAVMNPAGRLCRALSLPFFKPIATVSYGLYLLHSPILGIIESLFRFMHIECPRVSWTETGMAMLSMVVTILAAAVSWRFFESRMIALGHHHRYQPPPTVSGRTSAMQLTSTD
jgi:peptidoglycan/LPS O-acetylase OafA/YrhL